MALGERTLEIEPAAVGIPGDVAQLRLDGTARKLTGAQWIFVGRELDDAGLVQPHFARELGDRFAGLIRRNRADV
jgi:hypothetical protein